MKLKNNLILSVQKYKIAYEERKIVKEIFNSGMRDLNAHLEIFKRKLSDDIKNQKERYQNLFFSSSDQKEKHIKESNDFVKKPAWAKKIYKNIVLVTHPDKTLFIPVESVRSKFTNYYQTAVESYSNEEYENLLFIANDLGINIEDESAYNKIEPKLKSIQKEIENMKKTNAYQWAKIEKEKRPEVLESYLKKMGFVFSREEVKETIEEVKRIKRKVGTRPVNYIRNRIKS